MNSDHSQTIESNIPRRGRPRKNQAGPPPKSKSNLGPVLSGVRKSKPRAVKLVLPSVKAAAVQNLVKVTNKSSSEIVKNFPIAPAPAKDSPPITTFLLTPADGKKGTLASVSKSGSLPMTLVQHVTTSGPTSIKQLPVAVSTTIFPRVQVSNAIGSTPKLLLITTASNSAASVPITSTNQTLCKTLLPVKLGNNTPTSGSVVAGNLGKQVLYKIPSSQSSGMVLLSTTTSSQTGGTQKKFLLIPSSTAKRQGNAAVILNSKISQSTNPNSDKPLFAISSPTQTTCTLNDSSKVPTTIVPISNLPETTGKKLTRQTAASSSSPTKPVNTSRRRGSVLGANSTISSIPSGIFKTVACTTNSRGICSTPVSVQTSQKQSNVKLTQVSSGLAPHGSLKNEPGQQMCVLTPDASLNMTIPTVPQASLNTNPPTSNPHCKMPPVNTSKSSQIQCQSDTKPNDSIPAAKRSRPLPGHRAKKTIPKIDGGTAPSFITIPSSLPFSAIQLKPNCANAALSASSFSGLSLLVSPNTIHQPKSNPNSENETKTNSTNTLTKHKNIPKLIVVNGVSNGSFPSTQSAGSQTSNNDCKSHLLSANQYSQCSQNLRPVYATPPKLTIAPGFSPTDGKGSESGRKKRPSELMIIKEREEFIDDSLEKSNFDDLSPPKLQREDGPFNFEMTSSQESSFPSSYLSLAKLTSTAQTQSTTESDDLKYPSSSSTSTNQYPTFYQDMKPMVRKDNFPTLASLSALNNKYSEFISRLDQNKKISFGHLFNHFKLLADKKKSKNASAIMFQVAHSIHCCVVLATMDIERSVDLNDLPFDVEESMKCSVKCRRTFMKELFAEKAISSLLDPRFSLSVLKSSDSTGERPSRCYRSRAPTNSSSTNEDVSFSSNVTSSLLNIKTKLPDDDDVGDDEYPPNQQQQQVLINPNPNPNSNPNPNDKKSTTGFTSEASTQKSATDESFTSCLSCSTGKDCKCSIQCAENPVSESTNTKPFSYSTVPKEFGISSSCKNFSGKGKKRGKSESVGASQQNTSNTIKNGCSSMSELSSVLKVSSPSSTPQEFQLPGTLRYKIVPKGHISLSGNNSQEKDPNSINSLSHQTKIPVQSYIINGDKSTISPLRTISPLLTHPTEIYENKTKNLSESQLVRKRKYVKSSENSGKDSPPLKKPNMSKTKDNSPRKKPTKSPKASTSKSPKLSSSKSPKASSLKSPKLTSSKSPKLGSSKSPKSSSPKSPASTKLTVPLPETPLALRDPKHLYDEPTTVDRVVMLTPDGKPILTDADLQITFDESINCLTSPKKKGRYLKGKSLEATCQSILKNRSPKSPAKGKHSKKNPFPPPPKLNFLLKEIDRKLKQKYLSSSSSLKKDNSTNDSMFDKTDKSKKANIEKIISNITSGYPAFGPDSSRCTMKLYKYFVSTRIKNRAKKNGSHEINVPLTLYINWKTLSRQPFNKHRITSHALNVMAIKRAKQFSNFKKCKIRTRKPKPVKKKKHYFVTRRKGLHHISNNSQAKKNSNNKSTKKKYYKKKSKTPSSKTKKYIKKSPAVVSKKRAQALILARRAKEKKRTMKAKKAVNNSALAEKACPETLVNNNDDTKTSKTLKTAHKNLIGKKKKQLKEKRTAKKAVQFTISSSLPALRTTRSRVALPKTPETESNEIDSLCTDDSQIKTEPESVEIKTPDTTTTESDQQEMLNEQTYSHESPPQPPPPQPPPTPPVHPIESVEDEDLSTQSKPKVADLIKTEEKQTPAIDAKQDISNSQHESEENNEPHIPSNESASNPTSSLHSTNVKTVATRNQAHHNPQKLTSSTKTQHSNTLAQPANILQLPVSEEDEPPTEVTSLASASNPADETPEVATQKQLASPTVIEDSGNFIFEDDTDSLLPAKDISVSSCSSSSSSQDRQLNSMHSNLSAENNQPVISDTNSNTPHANIIPTIRSSAFSDKFDIGLSPQLARIQQLKDQLQEKQKALDLAKLHLK